jgi:tripartite-type tricarboxylate transporter receptor subunit TctC
VLLGAAAAVTLARPARAAWPDRPITLTHGFAAGGNADVVARIVGERLQTRLGQPVIIEPKPGAGGLIAAQRAARATADGQTLVILPGGHACAAAMYESLPYDPVADFSFISMATDFPFVLVTYPDHPVKTIADLIAAAKTAKQPLIYGSAGVGTGQHLSGALFAAMAGIPMQHLPFRGGAQGATELMGKRIDFLVDTPTLLLEFIRSGQLRPVAVTGSSRFFALPDVPTIAEGGVQGYATSSWLGLAAPHGLPADIAARLNTETVGLLGEASVIERLRNLGNVPTPTTPEAFKERVESDIAKWNKVVALADIKKLEGLH